MVFENSGKFAVVALWLKVNNFVMLLRLTLLLYFIHVTPVVRKVDNAFHWRNQSYPQAWIVLLTIIHFIAMYRVDRGYSAFELLGLVIPI